MMQAHSAPHRWSVRAINMHNRGQEKLTFIIFAIIAVIALFILAYAIKGSMTSMNGQAVLRMSKTQPAFTPVERPAAVPAVAPNPCAHDGCDKEVPGYHYHEGVGYCAGCDIITDLEGAIREGLRPYVPPKTTTQDEPALPSIRGTYETTNVNVPSVGIGVFDKKCICNDEDGPLFAVCVTSCGLCTADLCKDYVKITKKLPVGALSAACKEVPCATAK